MANYKLLWGEEFNVNNNSPQKEILNKIKDAKSKDPAKIVKSKKVPIEDKLILIKENVLRVLGRHQNDTLVIKDADTFSKYIDKAIENGIIAIDTETNNSLDPVSCKLMGPCIYTPGQKQAYIPLNHVDTITHERLSYQLTEEDVAEQFKRLSRVTIIMHNGSFDYQVIKCTTGIKLHVDWDTMIGARLLNENEKAGLKIQYISKIDPSIEKYSIESFFKDIEYAVVPPEIFSLYAATDAYMTYKLYEYQKNIFEQPVNHSLFNLFKTVEMPVMLVSAEMELAGVEIDKDYASRLSSYYHKRMDALDSKIEEELVKLEPTIQEWRLTPEAVKKSVSKSKKSSDRLSKSKSEQLSNPPAITSSTQLAILMYDILKLPVVDEESPRGTGESILEKLQDQFPLGKVILEKRGIAKLLNTFIEAIPAQVSSVDNRLHAHFNSTGTGTGRFSSSEPNLQNIPSSDKTIRLMFKARKGYSIVGGDFSQQEPRLLAHYAQDAHMIQAYREGKDLYATMAARVYGNDYWDNMEHLEDGTPNPEGKKRRSSVKSICLGLLYGRGTASVAEQVGVSVKEAQALVDRFFNGFPTIKKWIQETQQVAHKMGYVEDVMGRRRRLPDIQLPKYDFKLKDPTKDIEFNPILNVDSDVSSYSNPLASKYRKLIEKVSSRKDFNSIREQAEKDGISIIDNTGFISRAERQCVNARVQGGAGTITKIAMINVANDPDMIKMGFKILICVHDEIIGECPQEYAAEAGKRLSEIMIQSAAQVCSVPMKVDTYQVSRWYEDDFSDLINEKYAKLSAELKEEGRAEKCLLETYPMINPKYLLEMMHGAYQLNCHIDI